MLRNFALILLVLVGGISALNIINTQSSNGYQRLQEYTSVNKIGIDICPECIEESVTIINMLLNLVLDEGIVGSCDALCTALANATHSKVIGEGCDVACDALGIDEFVKLIIKEDLDPIYYCELIHLCPINDHGDAKFLNFTITPAVAPEGTTFYFECSFISVNGTGTGMINIEFIDPKNRTGGNMFWFVARPAGTYPERFGLDTSHLSKCDQSKELCNGWALGTYNVTVQVCNGECGSQHPHSSIYDTGRGQFEITKKP